ncbi:hypothetical protein ABFZ85_02200 [Hyphococcus formosus]|uniref:hypothetical protein n=1 Tax=Hyphococcus formosus TaxID=3143534 RepID=UPI00398B6B87
MMIIFHPSPDVCFLTIKRNNNGEDMALMRKRKLIPVIGTDFDTEIKRAKINKAPANVAPGLLVNS